ncbi:hypothetical protein AB4Y45_32415 [Paraburkholderia sp. EG287A]|uniref:hypothetical protein n=1 Tax=Paraburkholderia sp. EG287A TaxID=3237012 RepID=UPI0034D170A3
MSTNTKRKQVIAVITFDDPEDNILGLSDAATWLDGRLRPQGVVEVTTFTTAAHAAAAETAREGDFAIDAERLVGH